MKTFYKKVSSNISKLLVYNCHIVFVISFNKIEFWKIFEQMTSVDHQSTINNSSRDIFQNSLILQKVFISITIEVHLKV